MIESHRVVYKVGEMRADGFGDSASSAPLAGKA